MSKVGSRALTALLPALAAALLAASRSPGQASADTTTRAVDRVFEAFRDTEGPGCALGVGRNGRAIYERGYGMANLETGTPIRPSSIFHVASVSKQFTAMAIMLLARDGKLSVDDNIRKYLPEIPDYGTPITIRHLLNHTSGLRDQWELLALARGRFEENRITEADVMDIVPRQKALNFTPGSEYLYSNTGYTLLAVIVKRVSGLSLRDFADQRIFKPLGMTSTHFHDDYTMLVPGRTSAYAPRGSSWHVSIPNFDTYGATSLYTTVGDLVKWEANFDNPIVGDKALSSKCKRRGV
jgi:CubicO group peptidase (beta-lactamase class C family)